MGLGDGFDDGETDAGPSIAGRIALPEDAFAFVLGDAGAVVFDVESGLVFESADSNGYVFAAVFARITESPQ